MSLRGLEVREVVVVVEVWTLRTRILIACPYHLSVILASFASPLRPATPPSNTVRMSRRDGKDIRHLNPFVLWAQNDSAIFLKVEVKNVKVMWMAAGMEELDETVG